MIFINYRKDDTRQIVGRLADRLQARFGAAGVFWDTTDLKGGERWPQRLRDELARRRVLLAVIGPQWLRLADQHGRRRIDDAEDWVRVEICTALEQRKDVVVLLVDGAAMPPAEALPEGRLRELPEIQALPLRSGTDFEADLARLVGQLEELHHGTAGATGTPAATGGPLLPACPRVCFGREEDLAALLDRIAPADPAGRVEAVPVTGIGGMGKTTLVLTALHHERVVARYGTRRHFARLDGAASRPAVLAAVAEAVGLPLGERLQDRRLEHLGSGGPRLLVLDNAEMRLLADDRLDTEELFEQLAGLAPLALVATLRAVHAGPGWGPPLALFPVAPEAARQTFLSQAGDRFASDPDLQEVLNLAEGWPLALTILGYRARPASRLKDLLDLWQRQRTALLSKGLARKDADIVTSIESSLSSPGMTDDGRRLLALLGLLPDGVHYDDLEALLPGAGTAAMLIVRQVGGLTFDDGPRLRVLAPVREYLAAHHPPSAEDRDWAVRFYCLRAWGRGDRAGRAGGAEAIQAVAEEVGNLTAMVKLGLQTQIGRPVFADARGLESFGQFRGVDFSALVAKGADGAAQEGDLEGQAACILCLGEIALARSDHAAARQAYERALPLFEQVGDRLGQAMCIWRLGEIALARSDHAAARQAYQRALSLYEQVGDLLGQATCIHGLGDIVRAESNLPLASDFYRQALTLVERLGDPYGIGRCHYYLAFVTEGDQRRHHVQAAREAWTGIDRPDLLVLLDESFRPAASLLSALGRFVAGLISRRPR